MGGRILLLENDYSNRILLAEYLEQCGYSVRPLANEQKILECLAAIQPDVLILNLRMPVIDGFTIIKMIRSHPTWNLLPILVVSGYTSASDRQKAIQLGANACLTKPVLPADLSAAVARLIG